MAKLSKQLNQNSSSAIDPPSLATDPVQVKTPGQTDDGSGEQNANAEGSIIEGGEKEIEEGAVGVAENNEDEEEKWVEREEGE